MTSTHCSKLNVIETAAKFNKDFKQEYWRWVEAINEIMDRERGENNRGNQCLPFMCVSDRDKYLNAEYFVKYELTADNLDELRDHVFDRIYPLIKFSTAKQISFIIRSLISLIASEVINRKITSFNALMEMDFLDMIISSKNINVSNAMDVKLLDSILKKIPEDVHGIHVKFNHFDDKDTHCRVTFFQAETKQEILDYDSSIEREFESTATRLK